MEQKPIFVSQIKSNHRIAGFVLIGGYILLVLSLAHDIFKEKWSMQFIIPIAEVFSLGVVCYLFFSEFFKLKDYQPGIEMYSDYFIAYCNNGEIIKRNFSDVTNVTISRTDFKDKCMVDFEFYNHEIISIPIHGKNALVEKLRLHSKINIKYSSKTTFVSIAVLLFVFAQKWYFGPSSEISIYLDKIFIASVFLYTFKKFIFDRVLSRRKLTTRQSEIAFLGFIVFLVYLQFFQNDEFSKKNKLIMRQSASEISSYLNSVDK